MTSPLPSRARFVMPWMMLAGAFLANTACGTILGIEEVTEIQPSGGSGGSGGAGGSAGTGGCAAPMCDPTWECGSADNGCNQAVQCGSCAVGLMCDTTNHACVPTSSVCMDMKYTCGMVDVGGMTVNCGECKAPSTCDQSSHKCVCPTTACQPGQCGSVTNECGDMLTCEPCGVGQMCDDMTHQCVCESTTCKDMGWVCGDDVTDNCNNVVSCGQCAGTEECNPNSHQCCAPQNTFQTLCAPDNPMGYICGDYDDGCGHLINCGVCTCDMNGTLGTCVDGTSCTCP